MAALFIVKTGKRQNPPIRLPIFLSEEKSIYFNGCFS